MDNIANSRYITVIFQNIQKRHPIQVAYIYEVYNVSEMKVQIMQQMYLALYLIDTRVIQNIALTMFLPARQHLYVAVLGLLVYGHNDCDNVCTFIWFHMATGEILLLSAFNPSTFRNIISSFHAWQNLNSICWWFGHEINAIFSNTCEVSIYH